MGVENQMCCVALFLVQVVVVLPTAGLVIFYAALFQAMGIPALELHSRKSHIHRTQVHGQRYFVARAGRDGRLNAFKLAGDMVGKPHGIGCSG